MLRAGIEIGSHTLTHPNLLKCGPKKAEEEIVKSRARLEEKLGTDIKLFAYPYGHARSFDKKIQTIVTQAGYKAACSTLPGSNGSRTNPYALRRISFGKAEIRYFALRLAQLTQGKLSPLQSKEIQGMNNQTTRLWENRYEKLGKRLASDHFFDWRTPK